MSKLLTGKEIWSTLNTVKLLYLVVKRNLRNFLLTTGLFLLIKAITRLFCVEYAELRRGDVPKA
jgi:hypothetical protein